MGNNKIKHKDALIEAKQYKDVIISNIKEILSNRDINYHSNKKETELVLETDVSVKDVKEIIYDELDIKKSIVKLLISISDSGKKIYIRLLSK